jgi:ubiquinone/menaquinone biosynthesis C-methylase UbiE
MAFGGEALACRGLALDVATGSGQVAVALSELFAAVVGCDSSEGQLSHAVRRPNIRYVLAPAEELPADPGSVDLVTCAQALHWCVF